MNSTPAGTTAATAADAATVGTATVDTAAQTAGAVDAASPNLASVSPEPVLHRISRRSTAVKGALSSGESSGLVVDVGRLMRQSSLVTSPTDGSPVDGAAADAVDAADVAEPDALPLRRKSTFLGVSASPSDEAKWVDTIERVSQATVSIEFSRVLPFDTDSALASSASGFVVDAARGIILTNRHVVSPGPFVGEAVFINQERVTVHAIYRDPVHDFGFLQYDPKKLHHIRPPSIRLDTSKVVVGTEVKIIGNDAGEDISILSGHISRLDRNAPSYSGYFDFNTFYMQTAANLSGGSSGSPVVDINGTAVALQCGGRTDAATNFFLPTFRIRRALELLQNGEHVPRGTIQTMWTYSSYAQLVRLGLPRAYEDKVRATFPEGKGMLLAHSVLPKGPAADKLQNDDILYTVNGAIVTDFKVLDEILDSSIGRSVEFAVIRDNQLHTHAVTVQDLHSITPSRLLRVSGAIVHDLSYIVAMANDHAVEGVYIANAGGPFTTASHIVTKVKDTPTPNLEAFIAALAGMADEERFLYTSYSLGWPDRTRPTTGYFDAHFAEAVLFTRNDATGLWDKTRLPQFAAPKPVEPHTVSLVENLRSSRIADQLTPSLADVYSFTPLQISGYRKEYYTGAGIVIDARKGLMLVQAETIKNELAEIIIFFAEKVEVRGKVVFTHPHHAYSVLKYDPRLLGDTPVSAVRLCAAGVEIKPDVEYTIVGVGADKKVRHQKTTLLPPKAAHIAPLYPATQHPINIEYYRSEITTSLVSFPGVIAAEVPTGGGGGDGDGSGDSSGSGSGSGGSEVQVVGLWFSGSSGVYGISADVIRDVVSQYLAADSPDFVPRVLSLGIECETATVVFAREMGFSKAWQERLDRESPSRASVLSINRIEAMGPADGILKLNDIILEINGKLPVKFSDLDAQFTSDEVQLKILRDKQELDLAVRTRDICLCGTGRADAAAKPSAGSEDSGASKSKEGNESGESGETNESGVSGEASEGNEISDGNVDTESGNQGGEGNEGTEVTEVTEVTEDVNQDDQHDQDDQHSDSESNQDNNSDGKQRDDSAIGTGCDGDAVGTERIVFWAGGIFQSPYKALLQQVTKVPSLTYCSSFYYGSPVGFEGGVSGLNVTHVNGVATPNLDVFLRVVKEAERRQRELGETQYVRLKVVSCYSGGPNTIAFKPDYHYFPTRELVRDASTSWGWRWIEHSEE